MALVAASIGDGPQISKWTTTNALANLMLHAKVVIYVIHSYDRN